MRSVGSVSPTPSPSSKVAGEMLNIFAIFGGGDKKLRALIDEMKEVQARNEQVIEQAQAARTEAIAQQRTARSLMDDAERFKTETGNERSALKSLQETTYRDLEERVRVVAVREKTIARETAQHEAKTKRDGQKAETRQADLDARQSHIEHLETLMGAKTAAFQKHVAAIASAYSRFNEVQVAVSLLHDWIKSAKI